MWVAGRSFIETEPRCKGTGLVDRNVVGSSVVIKFGKAATMFGCVQRSRLVFATYCFTGTEAWFLGHVTFQTLKMLFRVLTLANTCMSFPESHRSCDCYCVGDAYQYGPERH